MGKRLDTVIENCRRAYDAHVPILYLVTDDYKLIYDVIYSDSLCEMRYKYNDGSGEDEFLSRAEMESRGEEICASAVNFLDFMGNMTGEFPPKDAHGALKCNCPMICLIKNYKYQENIPEKSINKYVLDYIMAEEGSSIRESVMILTGRDVQLPQGVESYIEVIDVPLPEGEEIKEIIKAFAETEKDYGFVSDDFLNQLSTRLKGFEEYKIKEILSKIRSENGFLCDIRRNEDQDSEKIEERRKAAYRCVKKQKESVLKKNGILSYVDTDKEVKVGGLGNMLEWLDERKRVLESYDDAHGEWKIDFSKGVLLAGVPGCGKSLMAIKTAKELMLPLIRMDVGALQSSFHGQSEANMRQALKLVEATAPCVLWIDEIEKAFSGMKGSGEADGGAGQRVFATFLTWLQENDSPVFAFITSNDVSKLPSELLRLGRVSKKYSVFMPSMDDCIKIFAATYSNVEGKKQVFEKEVYSEYSIRNILEYCADKGKFLTGGDISEVVKETMTQYYLNNKSGKAVYISDIFYEHMKNVIDKTSPYGETNMEDIVTYIRLKEKNNFESASKNDGEIIKGKLSEQDKEKYSETNVYDKKMRDTIILTYKNMLKEDRRSKEL